jgi:hypothetical protein
MFLISFFFFAPVADEKKTNTETRFLFYLMHASMYTTSSNYSVFPEKEFGLDTSPCQKAATASNPKTYSNNRIHGGAAE